MSEAEVESHLGVVLQLAGAKPKDGGTTTKRYVSQRRKKT